jgi:hypothetical protein
MASAITRSEVLSRAKSWVDAGVLYDQGSYYGGYRQDCSGYVSMAWSLGSSYVTWTLPNVAHLITKDQLLPGDALLDNLSPTAYQHVLLFRGWADSAHTSYYAYEMTPPKAYAPTMPYPYWPPSIWPYSANFRPFRYNGITDGVVDRGNPIAPDDVAFTKGGAASGWTSFAGGVFGSAIYTYVNAAARDNWGRWTFDLSRLSGPGYYRVEAYVPSTHAGTQHAHYHINTSTGLQYSSVNQNALSNVYANLGTFPLGAGAAWVELDDLTGEPYAVDEAHQIAFDAVKLTYVGPASTLGVVGPVILSAGPYHNGDTVTGSFTVKNTGVQTGTWAPLILAFRGPSGQNRDAIAASSITLTSGQSQNVNFSRELDLTGSWTGFVSGLLGATWQSPAGATVAFPVAAALPAPPVPTPLPKPSLTLKLSGLKHGTMTLGKRLTASGTASPTSLAGSKVKLTVQKKARKWLTVKTAVLTIKRGGAYRWKYEPAKKGAYRVRATVAKTATNRAAETKWLAFKVK